MPEITGQSGNLLMIVPNFATSPYASLWSAISGQTGFLADQLGIQRTDSQWRSANWLVSDQWAELVLDQPRTINAIGLVAGKFTDLDPSLISWTADLSMTPAAPTSIGPQPWIVAGSAPGLTRDDLDDWNLGPDAGDIAELEASSRLHSAVLFRDSPVVADRIRITVHRGQSIPGGTSPFCQIAALAVGFGWQAEINFEWGGSFGSVETRDRVHRTFECRFPILHDADVFVRILRRFWYRSGKRGRVFCWFWPEKPAFFYEHAGLFALADVQGPTATGLWDGETDVEELRFRFVEVFGALPEGV